MNLQRTSPLDALAGHSRQAAATARQMPRRAAEQRVRRHAAEVCDELAHIGHPRQDVARRMRLSRRTLDRWCYDRHGPSPPASRGRPCLQSSPSQRRTVLDWLEREGPHLGLPTLRASFPNLPRCELRELQADYRRYFQAQHTDWTHELTWHIPGRVWAMDHAQPPSPIDGHQALLSVRDLASGMQLAWQAVPDQTAATTLAVLRSLIGEHGAPLIIKSDNGSAFKSHELSELLDKHRIVWLPSPPRTPQYNGSCEAGISSMKKRTCYFAARGGRTDCCTTDDLGAARRQANELNRPHGHLGPTPLEFWAPRPPIPDTERTRLATAIARHRTRVLAERPDIDTNNRNHQHQVHREAVRRALVELDLLTITRRPIPLPIRAKKVARIS